MKLKSFIIINISIFFLLNFFSNNTMAESMADIQEIKNLNLKITQIGDPVLRNMARPLSKEEILSPPIQNLISLMKNTMQKAPGVGLAAPQIGVPLQIAVIEDREEYLKFLTPEQLKARDRQVVPFQVLINPKLTILNSDKNAEFYEGCLSLDGFVASVARALNVSVDALNEKGEPIVINAHGWYARILQHEIDHLNGTLYIDRMSPKTLTTVDNYKKFNQ